MRKKQTMNKNILKKLAQMSIIDNKINEYVKNFVLSKLSIKELKDYIFYLKKAVRGNDVYVTIPEDPQDGFKKSISGLFKNKNICYQKDISLGAGLKLEYNDNIINLNVKSLIENTISNIKNTL